MSESCRTSSVELHGARALVTGGGVRLGRSAALALARCGVDVVVHYGNSRNEAEETVRLVREQGRQAWLVQANLGAPEERKACFREAVDRAGALDILVNNAAVFPRDVLRDIGDRDIESTLRINAFGPLDLMREFAAQSRPGAIVNYLDTRVLDYDHEHVSYHLSKRLLLDLTRMAALEFAPDVRVNAVAPGLILPPPGEDLEYLEALAHTNPMHAYGRPEDIDEALLFLVRSPFVTGQVIYVDGGRHMRGCVYGR